MDTVNISYKFEQSVHRTLIRKDKLDNTDNKIRFSQENKNVECENTYDNKSNFSTDKTNIYTNVKYTSIHFTRWKQRLQSKI